LKGLRSLQIEIDCGLRNCARERERERKSDSKSNDAKAASQVNTVTRRSFVGRAPKDFIDRKSEASRA
jgi:hypothetical protein